MKILFAGTPEFAVAPLAALAETGEVIAVVTQEDKPQGRKRMLTPSPVKFRAESPYFSRKESETKRKR